MRAMTRNPQANWTQHRLRLRQWAVLVVQRWARQGLTVQGSWG